MNKEQEKGLTAPRLTPEVIDANFTFESEVDKMWKIRRIFASKKNLYRE